MAGFSVHLLGGMVSGAFIGGMGLVELKISPVQAGAVFIAGTIGGLLPDIDSDTSKPLSFLFQLISVLIPSIFYGKAARHGGGSLEFLLCYFTISYIVIYYGVCSLIKKLTAHRGILHSIPFAFLCGGIGYLLFSQSGKNMGLYCGIAVFSGCLIHLILDEFYSLSFKFGFIPVVKRSTGTALKFSGDSAVATVFVYLLTFCVYLFVFMPGIESKLIEFLEPSIKKMLMISVLGER